MIKTINFLHVFFDVVFYSMVFGICIWTLKLNSDNTKLSNKELRFNLIRADIQMKHTPIRSEEVINERWDRNAVTINPHKKHFKKVEEPKKDILIEPDKIVPPPPKIEEHKISIRKHNDTV